MSETLLPPNATALERSVALQIAKISDIPVPYIPLYSVDACPVPFLPWLAWSKRVDFWDATWPEEKKRTIISDAKVFNRQRGTRASILYATNQIRAGWQLKSWYEFTPKATPYTFELSNPTLSSITVDEFQDLCTVVDATKSARDLYAVAATIVSASTLHVLGSGHTIDRFTISSQDSA